ncbi:restriction endonuclease [Nonomuraea soli]|uniref:Restriction system protein n=1 Tax=Nonomuraea soli TaxID=1032476 RepID=A0A7W0CJU2_9ACTN|nr:restriction endonuclease [Nonomuraea soli]MBA2892443.1 restriction system protein [Nonomuraea soli]
MTARRRPSFLPRPRMPVGGQEWIAAAVVGVIATAALTRIIPAIIEWLFSDWRICAAMTAAAFLGIVAWQWWKSAVLLRRAARLENLRLSLEQIDVMSPTCFEWAVRDLMIRDGMQAQHVGQRGDKAADVIGHDRRGHRIVVQCKHTVTSRKVTAQVVYQVNGTARPAHGAEFAVIVTNGDFTRDARKAAGDFRIQLVGRGELEQWASNGVSLAALLGLGAPLRHRRRLRRTAPLLHPRAHDEANDR